MGRGFPASHEAQNHAMNIPCNVITNSVKYYAATNSNSNIAWTSHIESVYCLPLDSMWTH